MGFSLELSDFVSLNTKHCHILIPLYTFYYFPSKKPDRKVLYCDQYTSRLTESKIDSFNLEDKLLAILLKLSSLPAHTTYI